MNYDPSQVGVPYVRVSRLTIDWPDSVQSSMPSAKMEQSLAVKLADGSIRTLEKMPDIVAQLDFTRGNEPIPLIDPETGANYGSDTSLNQAMMTVLAVIRQHQRIAQG